MSKITDFMRKIGLLQVSKGDSATGEFDSREDLKDAEKQEQTEETSQEAPAQETPEEAKPQEEAPEQPEGPKMQM